jgi:molecular chaperone GrpE
MSYGDKATPEEEPVFSEAEAAEEEADEAAGGAGKTDADAAARAAAAVGAALAEGADHRGVLQRERDEYLLALQRTQADFENYRKRMLREQTDAIGRANEVLIEQLLPVLDSAALAVTQLDDADEGVRKGIELVFAELAGVVAKAGLERIDDTGVPFDPNIHEAVLQEGGPGGEPVVAELVRPGYRLKGKVLRPAMVKVAHQTTD